VAVVVTVEEVVVLLSSSSQMLQLCLQATQLVYFDQFHEQRTCYPA
jgi:hypothetical protein